MSDYPSERTAIVHLFAQIAEAWNKGDGGLYGSYFTIDCDYVTFEGQHVKGREQIAAMHTSLFNEWLKGSKLSGELTSIRFLSAHLALVHQTGGVKMSFQRDAPKSRRSINTNVVMKDDSGWRVTAFQNTRIQKPALIVRMMNFFQPQPKPARVSQA